MSLKGAETEFLLISEAVARLKAGMFGGLKRPRAVWVAKETYPRASIGWGPQKEDAANRVYEAIVRGKLSVFVMADSEGEARGTPLRVPPDVLGKMIRTRGGLPDRAVQPMRVFAKDPVTPQLLAALSKSELYVRRKEYGAWYEKAKKRRNWPSQRIEGHGEYPAPAEPKPKPMGRPSKQNDLRDPIRELMNKKRWSNQQTIAYLVRLLESEGRIATRDTARRVVDQLHKETGEQSCRRRVRRRSKVKRNGPGRKVTSI